MDSNAVNPTYILIDFENIQPAADDLRLIQGDQYQVRVFHGSHQSRFDKDMVKALQPLGERADYIECEKKGKNALDFRIAFFLGGIAKEFESHKAKPAVVVISKDTDLDTLLDHVRSLGFDAKRSTTIRDAMSSGKPAKPAPVKGSTASKQAPKIVAPKMATSAKPGASAEKMPLPMPPPAKSKAKSATSPPTPHRGAQPDLFLRAIEHLRDQPNNRPTSIEALERYLLPRLGIGTSLSEVKKVIERLQIESVVGPKGKKIEYKIPGGTN